MAVQSIKAYWKMPVMPRGINSFSLFPQMHYPAQGKSGGKIFPLFASKNVYYLGGLDLTNRFHVAVRLFSNISQMTSKCGKNKEVTHEPREKTQTLRYGPN